MGDHATAKEGIQKMKKNHMIRLVLSALFLAIGFVLPFLTGQIPEVGSMLLVSFALFLLPHLAAALVIRLVDAVLALRGFIKS